MSAAAAGTGGRKGDPVAVAVIGIVVVALVAAFIWFRSDREPDIGHTVVGFDGLIAWLDEHDIEARRFEGGGTLSRQNVGLRVFPILDDDLEAVRPEPEGDLEFLLQTSEADVELWIVRRKVELLDTMLVLPKWRSGMRAARIVHEILLIPGGKLDRLIGQIGVEGAVRRESGFRTMVYEDPEAGRLEAAIYAPQTIRRPGNCRPLIGSREAMLLGDCKWDGVRFLLLADPDLLDNHGLRLGDNAEIALALARRFAGDKPVLYDATKGIHAVDLVNANPAPEPRDRSWEDLARMLDWPFTVVWAALISLALLVAWRSWVRYGPAARPFRDGLRASKEVSIAAKGRLLRLSGHDRKLLETWAQARCQRLAAETLGPHRPAGDPAAQVAKALGRRDPALAREFEGALRDIARGSDLGQASLVKRLDRFEKILERVLDGFGRTATARR